MATLLNKSGSKSPLKHFRYLVKAIADTNHLPDYTLRLAGNDLVEFTNRETMPMIGHPAALIEVPALLPDTYALARQVAPGWDVYSLEQEWRAWITERPHKPDSAFVGFCRKWSELRGRP